MRTREHSMTIRPEETIGKISVVGKCVYRVWCVGGCSGDVYESLAVL